LRRYIDENLKIKYIRLSTSLVGYLILFVLKKDRKLWMYIDYQ
jgi:hypothetical protein